jgi:putative addiction module component (TIGR02574 family)
MTHETRDLLERALKLPHDARAEIVRSLIESLEEDSPGDPAAVARAWREELARRHHAMIAGRDPGVSAEEALADLRKAVAEERARHRS